MPYSAPPETRLYLEFSPDISHVDIWVPPQNVSGAGFRCGAPICGNQALESFLATLKVDLVLTVSGDSFRGTLHTLASSMTPSEIIAAIEERFRREDAAYAKAFRGEPLTSEDEPYREHMFYLQVASSTLPYSVAVAAAQRWCQEQPTSRRA